MAVDLSAVGKVAGQSSGATSAAGNAVSNATEAKNVASQAGSTSEKTAETSNASQQGENATKQENSNNIDSYSNNNGENNSGDGGDEQPQKSQDEINAENNKKALDAAAEIAEKTGNPYAVAAAKIYKGANKLTGGKAGEKMGQAMNKINKVAPGGKDVQELTNALGKSGTTDAVKNGVGATNGGGAAAASQAASDISNNSPEKAEGKKEVGKVLKKMFFKKVLLPWLICGGGGFFLIIFLIVICGPTIGGFSSATDEYGSNAAVTEANQTGEGYIEVDPNIKVDPISDEMLAMIVSIARGDLGILEGSESWKKYGQSGPWCAAFVSWVLKQAGWTDFTSHSCNSWRNWLMRAGKWGAQGSYSPKAGDLVIFDWEGDGVADHIGIVTANGGSTVYTIEGNTGDPTGRTSKDGVFNKSRSVGSIMGYGVL